MLAASQISLNDLELTRFFVALLLLVGTAHVGAIVFARLRLPRVIGEIAGGLLLGPTVLGALAPDAQRWVFDAFPAEGKLIALTSWFGLILLMFVSGLEIRTGLSRADRRVFFPLLFGATLLPFGAGLAAPFVHDFSSYMGPRGNTASLVIIIGIAVAITSIPVISKIFLDLGIINTRFARLVLAVAAVEDIALWGLLAVATGLAGAEGAAPSTMELVTTPLVTIGFFVAALTVLPMALRRTQRSRAHALIDTRPSRFALLTCLALVAMATLSGVNVVFGALLAGMAIARLPGNVAQETRRRVRGFAMNFFTPVYFAVVGLKLDLASHFDVWFFVGFLVFCTIVKTLGTAVAARAATGDWLSTVNLAAALNCRGGPGIVLATVAFDLEIIDERFFVAMVLVAVVTSVMAGSWFRYVLGRGWELLRVRGEENEPVAAGTDGIVPNAPIVPAGVGHNGDHE
jgi:Kef-type K+ transport system membrane component KefB